MQNKAEAALPERIYCSPGLELRAVSLKDSHDFLEIIKKNQDYFKKFEFISPEFEKLEEVESVINSLTEHRQSLKGVSFGLWSERKLLGLFTINKVDWDLKEAIVGYWLGEHAAGKGYATLALNALVEYCFHKLNVLTISAYTAVTNVSSRKLLEKVGFNEVRVIKENVTVRGNKVDDVDCKMNRPESFSPRVDVELHTPSLELCPYYLDFVQEMKNHGEKLWAPYVPATDESAREFVERLLRHETNPIPPFVPESVYWAVSQGKVIGRIALRHKLDGNLSKIGGHIGYEVRPTFRKKGFAKEMLRQVLLTQKAKQIGKLLLTCKPDNIASNKTILANRGVLSQTIFVDLVQENRNHYWIDLSKTFDLQPILRGELLELRPLKQDDFNDLFLAASDPLIWEQHPFPDRYKAEVFRDFFDEAMKSKGALVVIDLKTREIIGSSRYYELDQNAGHIVVGYTFLKRQYWGGKYNREMKQLMMNHAFNFVPTVQFHVDVTNLRSQKAMEKIGGRRVGQFQRPPTNGVARTAVIYVLQNDEGLE